MWSFMEFLHDLFSSGGDTLLDTVSSQSWGEKAPLYFFNTLSGQKEPFSQEENSTVKMYNCGPTVYGRQHIGNLSMFVFTDVLRRTLEYNEYKVKQVINFTDVGHLSSDADEGEDKMTAGLKRDGLELTLPNMRTMAEKYAKAFLTDLEALNIDTKKIIFPYASDYIDAQINLIKRLEEKGYAYSTSKGVYFDTTKFTSYGNLGNINLEGQKAGARIGPDAEKKSPHDFNLWKKDEHLGWNSPWGMGFPGWHIECSAMIHELLGEPIDIHTGGIEHIPVHHNNEIAQTEAAFGARMCRFWLHRAHIQIDGAKIAKSEGNTRYLSDIRDNGYDPLVLRYLFLTAHYRSPMNFSWESLKGARNALQNLKQRIQDIGGTPGTVPAAYKERFLERLNDDLDTPGALAVMWDMLRDNTLLPEDVLAGIYDFDRVFGLDVANTKRAVMGITLRELVHIESVPAPIRDLITRREIARQTKNWEEADALRNELFEKGYELMDGAEELTIYRT